MKKENIEARDTQEKPLVKVKPIRAALWVKRETLQRIYIQTVPYTKTFYDMVKSVWKSDSDIDLEDLRKKVFQMYGAGSSDELYEKVIAEEKKEGA